MRGGARRLPETDIAGSVGPCGLPRLARQRPGTEELRGVLRASRWKRTRSGSTTSPPRSSPRGWRRPEPPTAPEEPKSLGVDRADVPHRDDAQVPRKRDRGREDARDLPEHPCTASSRNTGSPRRRLPPVRSASAALLGEQEDVPDRDPPVRPLAHVVDRQGGDRRRDQRLHLHTGPVERLHRARDDDRSCSPSVSKSTEAEVSAIGWASGIRSHVFFAAAIPAIRAIPKTSPLLRRP